MAFYACHARHEPQHTGEPDPREEKPRAAWSERCPRMVHTIRRARPVLIDSEELSEYYQQSLWEHLPYSSVCFELLVHLTV
jgi:hypothetical protein